MSNEAPSPEVLAERIRAQEARVNDRFIALEVRLKEKFEALDKALKLAASGHKAGVSMWLSVVALLIAAASIVVKAFGHA